MFVDTYGTGSIPDKEILAKILEKFDFRPGEKLSLRTSVAHSTIVKQCSVGTSSMKATNDGGPGLRVNLSKRNYVITKNVCRTTTLF